MTEQRAEYTIDYDIANRETWHHGELTLRQLQAEVGAWHRKHFPKATPTNIVLKALEEVAELAAAHNQKRVEDDIPADRVTESEMAEIGDTLIVLCALCDRLGLDIVQVLNQRWQTVKGRSDERIHRRGEP